MPTIQEECAKRNIDCLFHFTRLANVPQIMKFGLRIPSELRAHGMQVEVNDAVRQDKLDAICLSVEWPNYKMFTMLRKTNPDVTFVLLHLKHSILWERRCCFSVTNAADASVSGIPWEQRSGYEGFMAMFNDYGEKTRASTGVADNFPTNPQAEVSVLESLHPAYISGILVNDDALANKMAEHYPNVVSADHYHWGRPDWAHWKN